ncbi:hypothetical protein [Streptomyces sp. NPDC021020]|uniref:hypothetical protein n=1 Tax=Streptomyces sp. NPDC021020 TaxID=3365109 RepID=UPI0037AE7C55
MPAEYAQGLLDTTIVILRRWIDAEAARIYGRVCAAVIGAGRKPRRRVADLMIAAIAIAEGLPLFTTNPDDYKGLDGLLTVVPVARPTVLHDR